MKTKKYTRIDKLADEYECSYSHMAGVLNGNQKPSYLLAKFLVKKIRGTTLVFWFEGTQAEKRALSVKLKRR